MVTSPTPTVATTETTSTTDTVTTQLKIIGMILGMKAFSSQGISNDKSSRLYAMLYVHMSDPPSDISQTHTEGSKLSRFSIQEILPAQLNLEYDLILKIFAVHSTM